MGIKIERYGDGETMAGREWTGAARLCGIKIESVESLDWTKENERESALWVVRVLRSLEVRSCGKREPGLFIVTDTWVKMA